MTDPNLAKQGAFDQIRLLTKDGTEYWRARDLQPRLGYDTWENFERAILRAMEASNKSGYPAVDQFRETTKTVEIGSGAQRLVKDYFLSRYASYLIAMNGDPTKPEIAAAQTYFAIQARRQELQDGRTEDEKRLAVRERVRESNSALSSTAKRAGVQNFGFFHDAGYQECMECLKVPSNGRRASARARTFSTVSGVWSWLQMSFGSHSPRSDYGR